MATPTLDKFLGQISGILQKRDGPELRNYLAIEPPFSKPYQDLIAELRENYAGDDAIDNAKRLYTLLEKRVSKYDLDKGTDGASPSFYTFLQEYLFFIRDVEQRDVAAIFQSFREVMKALSSSFGDSVMGAVMFETAMFYSFTLTRFTRQLEKSPELIAPWLAQENAKHVGGDPITLPGLTMDSIRLQLDKCTPTARSKHNPGVDKDGRPAGPRAGIYILANACFPLCLRTGSMESLEIIIRNIDGKSPALHHYPIAQRVKYLYYLGRYWFAYNHYGRAKRVLQEAYIRTPARFQQQRTQILTYLIASNMTLGLFPSQELLQRPEAASLRPHFAPIAKAIKQGNLPKFRSLLDPQSADAADSATANFLFRRSMLIQLRTRCEILMYRSLFRRVFVLDGFHGDQATKAAPNFDLGTLRAIIVQLEKRAILQSPHSYHPMADDIDPDFEGSPEEFLKRTNGGDFDGEDEDEDEDGDLPGLAQVEAIATSLIYQGLLHGNIIHRLSKVLITGARGKNPVEVGFPRVCDIARQLQDDNERVPGWITTDF